MTIPPKYEDVVAKLDSALGREASLQKRLNDVVEQFIRYESSFEQVQKMTKNMEMISHKKLEALQQRLTVAEQRETELIGLLKLSLLAVDDVAENCEDQTDFATANSMHALSKRITAALNPAAEGGVS